jgi:uncharacterized protein
VVASRMPERTCVGCRGTAPKSELVRIARVSDGVAGVDPAGTSPGRGAYVHRSKDCVEAATKRGALARALRAVVPEDELGRLSDLVEGNG